jgi:hypothetical protein
MGQYFAIVNLTKRQYFDSGSFGGCVKKWGTIGGKAMRATGLLLTDEWAGDKIAVVGDYGGWGLVPADDLAEYEKVHGTDDEGRNLYFVALSLYEDVGKRAAELLAAFESAEGVING